MAGNTFGHLFRVTTFGESHGGAVGAVVDGATPGIPLSEEDIQVQLDRRKPGQSEVTTPRSEPDTVQILSGIFEGKMTGTPILMLLFNRKVYPEIDPRPEKHLLNKMHKAIFGNQTKPLWIENP